MSNMIDTGRPTPAAWLSARSRASLVSSVGLTIFSLVSLSLQAHGSTLDFEGLTDGTSLTNQYPGATFSNSIVLMTGISLNEYEFPPHSGAGVVSDNGGALSITFTPPVTNFGGYFTYLKQVTIQGFDASGNPVASVTSAFSSNMAVSGATGSSPKELLQIGAAAGISKITITGDPSGTSFTLDDVSIIPAPTAPMITWPQPAAITYGTPLGSSQLNSTASVPGTFAYSPPAGTVLNVGSQTLSVTFTPTDTTNYTTVTTTVTLQVNPALPAAITATAGTPQSATINTVFGTQLQATVVDSNQNPVPNVMVTFTAAGSGASGSFGGGVNTATTNAQGVATAPAFTANSTAGSYQVTASVNGVTTAAAFSLTNRGPVAIATTSGAPQATLVNTTFAAPLVVTVTDSVGNRVSGITVTFIAPASGASGTFAGGVSTAVTNSTGVATAAAFTANTLAGSYVVAVTTPGVTSSASFTLTNTVGAPGSITPTPAAGTPQSTVVNTAFSTRLASVVTDGFGNPVSGVTVTFVVPASGASGSFAGNVNTAVTDATGTAVAPVFTANTTAGNYVVMASAAGVANAATFRFTNLAGSAAAVTPATGSNQSATIATQFGSALQATVVDSFNNPVANATVTFTTPNSGASGTFAGGGVTFTSTTDGSGQIAAPAFTANTFAGSYTVTAAVAGVATTANFSLTNTAGPAGAITVTAGASLSATVSTAFPTAFQVQVVDVDQNPVPNAAVTFTAPSTGASGSFGGSLTFGTTTNLSGVATAPAFTANTIAGSYAVTATTASLSVSFNLSNTAAAAAAMSATGGTPQSAQVQTQFGRALQATVLDSFNNPVPGVTVAFTPPGSGASGTFAGGVTTAVTNANGVAMSSVVTANTVAGSYTVTASAAGVATPVQFSLTNSAGPPGSIAVTAGMSQSATVLTNLGTDLQVVVKDADGNPVAGVTVTFAAPGSGASGSFGTGQSIQEVTDGTGTATAGTFTANSVAGSYVVTATAPGVTTAANFALSNTAGAAAAVTATAGTPQSATIDAVFGTQLQATVVDANQNPVPNTTVTFTAPSSGASGNFVGGVNTATTNAQGVATASAFTANATAGSYTVTASVTGVTTPATFSLTNRQATPAIAWPKPAAIMFGSALGNGQLNATASVPGTFVYSPSSGTVMLPGNDQALSVSFTPLDTTDFNNVVAGTTINVLPGTYPGVQIIVTRILSRDPNGNIMVHLNVANAGLTAAADVTLINVRIGTVSGAPIPLTIGTIPANSLAQATVTVPGSAGAAGALVPLTVTGTYIGGTFTANARTITLP